MLSANSIVLAWQAQEDLFLKMVIMQRLHDQSQKIEGQYNFIISLMMQRKGVPNPRGLEFQSRKDVQELTNLSKNLFDIFPVFELEASRLIKMSQFIQLIEEIQLFNDELNKWKKNQHEIKNIIVTYHLYENLFSRMKFVSNFCKSQQESQVAISKLVEWFQLQKPKLRCQVKQKSATLKTYTADPKEDAKVDKMLQTNIVKRQLEAYEMMSRTAHPGFFPPKQMLKQYKRKQFLPFSAIDQSQNPVTAKKSTSASLLSKNRLSKFRMSVGTMATSATSFKTPQQSMKNTVSQFKIQNIPQQNKAQGQKEDEQKKKLEQKAFEQQIDEAQREDLVQKDQILQGNLVPQLGQQDAPDAQQQNIYQDEQIKQQKKIYSKDFDPEEIQYTKELIKENQQSTLRRVMKINEDKIRSKLQDLDIRRNMINWGKVKGRNNKEEMRRLEGLLHCNRYNDMAFKKRAVSQLQGPNVDKVMSSTTGFNAMHKQPVVVPMLFRSKSSHPGSIQSDIQKLKIKQAYKTYGRYINHLPTPSTPQQVPEEQGQKKVRNNSTANTEAVRSMSLTSLAVVPKKNHFSNVLMNNNTQNYNQRIQDQILRMKTSLSKKGAAIEKGTMYRALSSVPVQEIHTSVGFYTAGRDLPSNPFFPKNIGKKKKKK